MSLFTPSNKARVAKSIEEIMAPMAKIVEDLNLASEINDENAALDRAEADRLIERANKATTASESARKAAEKYQEFLPNS